MPSSMPKPASAVLIWTAILILYVVWGSTYLGIRVAVATIPPFVMGAGRFATAGRPGARRMLEDVPHQRGPRSGALVPDGGLAALDCEAVQRVPAGDHLLVIASVLAVPYLAETGDPLIRFAGRYLAPR